MRGRRHRPRPPHTFDLIVSRLALHYVDDLDSVLAACRRSPSPGGRLLITVVHPVITSHEARQSTGQARTNWVVDHYFHPGVRQRNWLATPSPGITRPSRTTSPP
ncbi:methyltransferase domain-containing protein [Nonomuraea sp. GTA35]|uniref:methyltransferase domain-containing protein n=1 Tax=Nonomuraea sp. GTA35 TaxID=1676746 RepID=UPI0035C1A0D9